MRQICLAMWFVVAALPAWANARVTVLMDVLNIAEVIGILRDEGFANANILEEDMLLGQGGPFWNSQIKQIYDVDKMSEILRSVLENRLLDQDIARVSAFFGSVDGTRIVELENAARRAMSDPGVEEAARDIYLSQRADPQKAQSVSDFIVANDLIERNVTGAMSATFHFYSGLSDGRFEPRSETDILKEVWSQEEDIRIDTEEWLNGYLLMAYQPLSTSVLRGYIEFSESSAGQALNAALFEGFEIIFSDVSYALGRAIALNSNGDEI